MADSMIPVPYARQRPYDNDAYVQAMSELMMRNSERQQQLMMARGQNSQQMWSGLGNLTMATMAQIGNQHDEQQKLKALQAERDRDYAIKLKEMEERRADRQADLDWRNQQFREGVADKSMGNLPVDTVVPQAQFDKTYANTSAASAFTPQQGLAARLPATPAMDAGGFSSYVPPATSSGGIPRFDTPESATPSEVTPMTPAAGGTPDDYMLPYRRSMSTDTAEVPEGQRRIASQSELMQLKTLQRQAEATAAAAENMRGDNAARDAAAKALAEYRAAQLRLQSRRTAAAEGRTQQGRLPTTASLALAAAGGDPRKAIEIIQRTEGGNDPRKMTRFNIISGNYQNSPLIKAADRTVILDDAIKAIDANPADPASQTQLAYSFVQVLDTYQSAVREGELANIGAIDSVIGAFRRRAEGVLNQNQVMNADTAKSIAATSRRMIAAIETARAAKEADFGARAKVEGVGDMWDEYRALANASRRQPATPAGGAPTSPFNDPNAQPGKKP